HPAHDRKGTPDQQQQADSRKQIAGGRARSALSAQPAKATGPQANTSLTSCSAASSLQRPDSTRSTARSAIWSAASRAASSLSRSSQKNSESVASRMLWTSAGSRLSPSGPSNARITRPYASARRLVIALRVAVLRPDV